MKPVRWVGTSLRDLRDFPQAVRRDIGQALFAAQQGRADPSAKPLKGFGGAGVLEVISDFDGETFRAVYTGQVQRRGLCAARLSEEIEKRSRDATGRDRQDQVTIETSQRAVCGKRL